MTTLEHIQQEIQTLPEDTLDLLAQFIQLLKKSQAVNQDLDNTPLPSLIGSAPGSFATPAAADQFIRQERDSWDS